MKSTEVQTLGADEVMVAVSMMGIACAYSETRVHDAISAEGRTTPFVQDK